MAGGNGKGYATIIFLCFFLGIPLYLFANYFQIILALIAIVIGIVLVYIFVASYIKKKQLENITHVQLIGKTDIYRERFENTGFSIGTNGHGRAYFRRRKDFQKSEVSFYITYSDKDPQTVLVMDDSKAYFKLLSYIERQNNVEQECPKIAEQEASPELSLVQVEKEIDKPRFLDIPFVVLQNEYSVEVKHQSCIYKRMEYDKDHFEVDIRCEVYYNPLKKGITNRKIVVSLYDKKDRIIAVKSAWPDRLDKSGCKVLEINFGQNILEEPSKVSISIDRCS